MSSLSPDPTLTVGNVIRAMKKAAVDKRRRVWGKVLTEEAVEEIYSSHSNEEDKLHSCADTYVNCRPNSSWEELVRKLYYDYCEMAAAKEAKAFLQQKGGWYMYVVRSLSVSIVHSYLKVTILQVLMFDISVDWPKNAIFCTR